MKATIDAQAWSELARQYKPKKAASRLSRQDCEALLRLAKVKHRRAIKRALGEFALRELITKRIGRFIENVAKEARSILGKWCATHYVVEPGCSRVCIYAEWIPAYVSAKELHHSASQN